MRIRSVVISLSTVVLAVAGGGLVASPPAMGASAPGTGSPSSQTAMAPVIGSRALPGLRVEPSGATPAVTAPTPHLTNRSLQGVVAISASDAWTVGYSYDPYVPTVATTLIEHWDGKRWSIVASPSPAPINELFSVTAITPTDVWAAGWGATVDSTGITTGTVPLTLHYDGSTWKDVPVVIPVNDNDTAGFTSITASTTRDVWAVGTYGQTPFTNLNEHTLIEHWDGTAWSVVAAPDGPGTVGQSTNALLAVAGAGPNDVWASGWTAMSETYSVPLMEHWDGTAWTVVRSAVRPSVGIYKEATGVVNFGRAGAWTADDTASSEGPVQLEHLFGRSWTAVSFSTLPAMVRATAMGGTGPSDVWTVGWESTAFNGPHHSIYIPPFAAHFNGQTWTRVAAPSVPAAGTFLFATASAAPNDVWAVGATQNLTGNPGNINLVQPVIEHWDGSAWTLLPAAT